MHYWLLLIAILFFSGCFETSAPRDPISKVERRQCKSTRVMRARQFPRDRNLDEDAGLICPRTKPREWTNLWFSVCRRILWENEKIISEDSKSETPLFPHLFENDFEDFDGTNTLKYELKPVRIGESVLVYRGVRDRHPSAIFKYQLNCGFVLLNSKCDSIDRSKPRCLWQLNEDSLKQEFVFSKVINDLAVEKVCPKVFALSPPVDIPSEGGKWKNFKLLETMFSECVSLRSSIRLIVEEEIGSMVDECLVTSPITDRTKLGIFAIKSFIQTMLLLKQIHTMGFIHGDIHLGNIGWRGPDDSCDYENPQNLLLIDFGLSEFFPPDIGTQEKGDAGLFATVNPIFLSTFQLAGFRRGRRDDVYRAFQNMIHLLSGGKLLQIFTIARHVGIHNHGYFHRLKTLLDITTDSPDPARFSRIFPNHDPITHSQLVSAVNSYRGFFETVPISSLKSVLQDMHNYVMGSDPNRPLPSPDSEPDYDWLVDQANRILQYIP